MPEPDDVWILDKDDEGRKMWINPYYGLESYLSQDENAKIIQKCVRNHQVRYRARTPAESEASS